MPKRYPCEFFLKALLLRHTAASVLAQLPALGFDGIQATYLMGLRSQLQRTRPMPDLEGPVVESWLRDERILALHQKDPMAMEARLWLADVRIRPTLEMLLISGLDAGYISEQLEAMSGVKLDPRAVRFYGHYFWNRELLDRADWKDFLTETPGSYPVDRYPNGRELLTAYLADPQVALWRTGIVPELDSKVIVDTILGDTVMRWLELKIEPNTLNLAKRMEIYWNIVKGTLEEQRVAGHALTKVYDSLNLLSLELQKMPRRDARELLDRARTIEDVQGHLARRMIGPVVDEVE